jgi:hypothetical protein
VADRFVASGVGVAAVGTLDGDAYEAWVAGYDPTTCTAKGRLRTDDQAVRFVEVVVNGPKSWSLTAALPPEIAAAYDAAQDRAAEQVIGWLAQHATTRVGPHGVDGYIPDPARRLADVERQTDDLAGQLQKARARVHALQLEPAIRALPAGRLAAERAAWRQGAVEQQAADRRAARATGSEPAVRGIHSGRRHPPSLGPKPPDRGITR